MPRENTIEIHFRTTVNSVCIILNQKEREKLRDSIQLFLSQYESKTLPRHKTNAKTSYYKSKCGYYYGVLEATVGTDNNDYWTNCAIIEKRAYFLLHMVPTRSTGKNNKSFTPKLNLYFSPSQLKDFLEILDQEYLNYEVEELRKKAYTY